MSVKFATVAFCGMKKKLWLFATAALLGICVASSAGAVEVVIATPEEPQGTDVQQVTWDNIVHQLLFEPLFYLAPDMKTFVPAAASKWEMSKDGKTLSFEIPAGRKFSDGEPLTAEAYKKSIERYLKISPFAEDLAAVKEVQVKGNTLNFIYKASAAPSMLSLGTAYGGAVEVKDAEKQGLDKAKSNIQSYGPMKMDKWVQGSHIRLVPNPDYKTFNPIVKNKGPIKVDAITIRFIPDSFTRVKELQAGDVDMIYNVPGERVAALSKDPNVVLHKSLQNGCDLLYINPQIPGLSDVKVRRAMNLAINRKELVAALAGTAEPRYGLLSPAMIGYSAAYEAEAAKQFAFDQKKAEALLDEAGYKMGKDGVRSNGKTKLAFTMLVAFDIPSAKKTAPVIQAQLKKVGITLNLREFERKYVNQACRDKKYEIATRSYIWADADMLTYLFHTESDYYSFPDVDKLIEAGRENPNPEVRAVAYAKAQKAIMDKAVAIPTVSNIDYTAYRKSLTGIILTPIKTIFVSDIAKQ